MLKVLSCQLCLLSFIGIADVTVDDYNVIQIVNPLFKDS